MILSFGLWCNTAAMCFLQTGLKHGTVDVQAKAMQDPEIQAILADPVMQQVSVSSLKPWTLTLYPSPCKMEIPQSQHCNPYTLSKLNLLSTFEQSCSGNHVKMCNNGFFSAWLMWRNRLARSQNQPNPNHSLVHAIWNAPTKKCSGNWAVV